MQSDTLLKLWRDLVRNWWNSHKPIVNFHEDYLRDFLFFKLKRYGKNLVLNTVWTKILLSRIKSALEVYSFSLHTHHNTALCRKFTPQKSGFRFQVSILMWQCPNAVVWTLAVIKSFQKPFPQGLKLYCKYTALVKYHKRAFKLFVNYSFFLKINNHSYYTVDIWLHFKI